MGTVLPMPRGLASVTLIPSSGMKRPTGLLVRVMRFDAASSNVAPMKVPLTAWPMLLPDAPSVATFGLGVVLPLLSTWFDINVTAVPSGAISTSAIVLMASLGELRFTVTLKFDRLAKAD